MSYEKFKNWLHTSKYKQVIQTNANQDQMMLDAWNACLEMQSQAQQQTDLSKQLREYAADSGYSHNDYADTMLAAASEIERCATRNVPSQAQQEPSNELKEMEARKDAAYLERNQVVAALAKCFPSGIAKTAIEGWSEDWHGCVYIDFPTGQASWHYHDSQTYLFADLPAYKGNWDGHTTDEKYSRIAKLQSQAQQEPNKDIHEAIILLSAVFDAWENGTDCYDDFDGVSGSFIGKAFNLDDEIFTRCCDLLNRVNPPRNASQAQQEPVSQWNPIETAPKNKKIIVRYKNALGKDRTVFAKYLDKFTEEASEGTDCETDYCEDDDTFYCKEGWVELIDNWDDFSSVYFDSRNVPTHWMPLPPAPEGGDK